MVCHGIIKLTNEKTIIIKYRRRIILLSIKKYKHLLYYNIIIYYKRFYVIDHVETAKNEMTYAIY